MAETYFADSSVLVKRHVHEIGSHWFTRIADVGRGNTIIIARLSITEVISAFNRRCRELNLTQIEYRKVVGNFEDFYLSEYQIIELTEDVTDRSCTLLEKYPLRASDAVQLASALLANEKLKQERFSELIFIASDQKLLAAAAAENLQTDNPQNHR